MPYSQDIINREIMRTLLYFDLFSYPLSSNEVYLFLQIELENKSEIESALEILISESNVFCCKNLYSVRKDVEALCEHRLKNNERAEVFWQKTAIYGKIIASFPFVRAVFISGSLSKNNVDENGDIDYFLICSPNRLWIARLLLMLFKKVFLQNKHTYFCINYLIDETDFKIHPQNIFTATELKTLVPIFAPQYYDILMQNNTWTNTFLPNYRNSDSKRELQPFSKGIKYLAEQLLSLLGERLNQYIFKKWMRYNQQKYPGQIFSATPNLASHHVQNRQDTIPMKLEKRINELLQ